MAASASKLFQPVRVGNIALAHRIVMPPLSRFRADDQHVMKPMAVEYYKQRSSAPGTLIVGEGTLTAPQASGYKNSPGIWTAAQIAAWKKVCDNPPQLLKFSLTLGRL